MFIVVGTVALFVLISFIGVRRWRALANSIALTIAVVQTSNRESQPTSE